MADQVDFIAGRTQAYDYVDGLPEIAAGLLLLAAGALLRFWYDLGRSGWAGGLLALAVLLVLAFLAFAFQQLVRRVKGRITYPRTGYAALRREADQPRQRRLMYLLVAVFIVALLIPQLNQLSFGMGAWLGAMLAYLGYRGGVRRFYFLAVAAIITGIFAVRWFDEGAGTAVVFLGTGILMLASGVIVFVGYLRRPVVPSEDTP